MKKKKMEKQYEDFFYGLKTGELEKKRREEEFEYVKNKILKAKKEGYEFFNLDTYLSQFTIDQLKKNGCRFYTHHIGERGFTEISEPYSIHDDYGHPIKVYF